MNKKVCIKCGVEKSFDCFRKDDRSKTGYRNVCRECDKKREKEYREKNIERRRAISRASTEKNKEKYNLRRNKKRAEDEDYRNMLIEKNKKWRDENPKHHLKRYKRDKEKLLENSKRWREKNKDEIKKRDEQKRAIKKIFFKNQFSDVIEFQTAWREQIDIFKNQERRKKESIKYKEKRKTDIQYKLSDNMRARLRKALKIQSAKKTKATMDLVGCTGLELSYYLESLGYDKFTDHIDHIIPISKFNLIDPEHQLIACHYLNLQPLHYSENCSKHDSLPKNWQDVIIRICEVRNINPQSIINYISDKVLC